MDCDIDVGRGGEGILVERGMEPLGDIAGVGKGLDGTPGGILVHGVRKTIILRANVKG